MIIVVHQVESAKSMWIGTYMLYRESPKAVAINVADSFYMKHMLSEQPKDIHC